MALKHVKERFCEWSVRVVAARRAPAGWRAAKTPPLASCLQPLSSGFSFSAGSCSCAQEDQVGTVGLLDERDGKALKGKGVKR